MLARALVGCALLTALAGMPSCSVSMAYVKREVWVPADLVPCVREALASDLRWTRKDHQQKMAHPPPPSMTVLLLETETGPLEIEAVVEADETSTRLSLRAYIEDAHEDWERKLATHRTGIATVYGHLREACPELPAWEETTEHSFDAKPDSSGASVAKVLLWVLGVPLAIGALIALLVGLGRQRAARRRWGESTRWRWRE